MDTDTIVAAMRSPSGGSAALLRAARAGRATLLATAPLCIEYESVCNRIEHVEAAGFSEADLYRPAQVLTRLPRLPRAGRAASAPDQDLCGLVSYHQALTLTGGHVATADNRCGLAHRTPGRTVLAAPGLPRRTCGSQ